MVKMDKFIEYPKPHWEVWTVAMQAQLVSHAAKYSISPSPWPVSGCYRMWSSTSFTGDNAERQSQSWQRQREHSKSGPGDQRLPSIKGKWGSIAANTLPSHKPFLWLPRPVRTKFVAPLVWKWHGNPISVQLKLRIHKPVLDTRRVRHDCEDLQP